MKAVLQRVSSAKVTVEGKITGQTGPGLLALLGVGRGDTAAEAELLADKTAGLRVFEDDAGKMNRSLLDVLGGALVISNFTLYADVSHGRRPSFLEAAPPEQAKKLYEHFCRVLSAKGVPVETGVFGADMQVSLVNDGPITIQLNTDVWLKKKEKSQEETP